MRTGLVYKPGLYDLEIKAVERKKIVYRLTLTLFPISSRKWYSETARELGLVAPAPSINFE